MQVVAWGRQRGLARAPCRFAPCFAGVTWTSHESISDSNCSTSFITSFNHLHHHTPRGEKAASSEKRIPLPRIFGVQSHKTKQS